ncbi:hypothetical protein JZ751_001276 [Albula glossodonta]|uniref:Major facilitator superfamily (MFS) profile domain-containing protein n=1 Tax=Albula glossodonta TaxID=121402 RepID=A0A8T2PT83_9TELE|nr:hypothetical protein JZ751_001276 [Albula glossodonta]
MEPVIFGYATLCGMSFVNTTWLGRYEVPVEESTKMLIWSFIVSVFSLGAWLGAIHGGRLPVVYGRELLGTDDMWPYLLALSGIPAIVQFLTLLYFPEAPRYIYIDKGDEEGCKKALKWLWGSDDLKLELEDMSKERSAMHGQKAKTVLDVLFSRSVRWQLLTLVFPCACVQFSGVTASMVIDRAGRKKLMGIGYFVMAIIMSLLTVMLYLKGSLEQSCFLIFVTYCILSGAFLLYFIPETKESAKEDAKADWTIWNPKDSSKDMFCWGEKGEPREGARSPRMFVEVGLGAKGLATVSAGVLLFRVSFEFTASCSSSAITATTAGKTCYTVLFSLVLGFQLSSIRKFAKGSI